MAFRPAGYLEEEEDEGEFYFGDEFREEDLTSFHVEGTTSVTHRSDGWVEEYHHHESTRKKTRKKTVSYPSSVDRETSPAAVQFNGVSDNDGSDGIVRFSIPDDSKMDCEDEKCDYCSSCMCASGVEDWVRGGGSIDQFGGHGFQKEKRSKQIFIKNLESSVDMRVAIAKGNVELVSKLLDDGVDLNLPLSTSWPPLLHACENCQESIVKLLLDRGADPNTSKDQLTALMIVCMNKPTSLEHQPEPCVRLLLEKGAMVNSRDRHGMTPLLYACQSGQLPLAKLLISAGADVNTKESRGWTPLIFAASKGHTSLLRLLVNSGADPKAVCSQGESPLSVAYSNNHTPAADWLESLTSSSVSGSCSGPNQSDGSLAGGTRDKSSQSERSYGAEDLQDAIGESSGPAPLSYVLNIPPEVANMGTAVGDLEIFLMGLQLGDLIPMFHDHKVEFSQLLSMTDSDLRIMGVAKVGSRKKILNAVLEMHKNEWRMPDVTLPYNRLISSGELCVMLSHLSRHANYLQGSAHFILTHLKSNSDLIGPHMEPTELKTLTESLSSAEEASQLLQKEVSILKKSIVKSLPANQVMTSHSSDQLTQSMPLSLKVVLGVGLVTGVSIGMLLYFDHHSLIPSPFS